MENLTSKIQRERSLPLTFSCIISPHYFSSNLLICQAAPRDRNSSACKTPNSENILSYFKSLNFSTDALGQLDLFKMINSKNNCIRLAYFRFRCVLTSVSIALLNRCLISLWDTSQTLCKRFTNAPQTLRSHQHTADASSQSSLGNLRFVPLWLFYF